MFIESAKTFWSVEPILVEIWEKEEHFFKCFGRHISAEGRFFFAKKRHGLLDKSSLFDPWINPLSDKKDLNTLKFNTLCYLHIDMHNDLQDAMNIDMHNTWKISARADGGPRSPSAHAWRSARPPIDTSGNFSAHVSRGGREKIVREFFWSTFSPNQRILRTFCFFQKNKIWGGAKFSKYFSEHFSRQIRQF
jgi:hypothetical protein